MTDFTLTRNSTGPIIEVFADVMTSVTDWSCSYILRDAAGVEVANSVVTETNQANNKFICYLSSMQTSGLDIDIYTWEITLYNGVLVPAFLATEVHTVMVEPQCSGFVNQSMIKGVNSFGTFEDLLMQLAHMPILSAARGASRISLKDQAIQAWSNVGRLNVDFENELSSTLDFDAAVIGELTANQQKQLIQAQLIEADFLLGGNPVETRRRMGLMSDSAGESAHFMRPTKPVVLPVCRDAAFALTPYIRYTAYAGR